jgi:glycerophosphoryl diester phosphodiesterase
VAAAGAAGLALHVWTVNAEADLAAMAALGVDAVITDRVTAALAATARGPRNGGPGAGSSTIGA